MAFVARLILIGLCALMFIVARRYKFAILILSTVCFSFVILPFIPFGGGTYLLPNCFFISEIPHIVKNYKKIRGSIIGNVLIIAFISIIIQIATSPHYNDSVKGVLKLLISDYVTKYLALGYAFICIANDRDLRPTIKVSLYGLIVLTLFGVANYLSGVADFVNALGVGTEIGDINELLGNKYTYSDRFRVQAMFNNPFDYGYICIVMGILHFWGYLRGLLSKPNMYISMACCLFGIFTCGCRTVIVCAFLAISSYLLFGERLKRRVQYFLLICIIGLISYSAIPYVRDKVDSTLTAFDADSDYGGSSIEMRTIQYVTVLKYINGHELFGRGRGFFNIDLGWSEGRLGRRDRDLHGLEGVFMVLLLESGIVGAIFYLMIYGILFYYSFKYLKIEKQLSSLSIAVLLAYFSFANMTGELLSPLPTLLVFGSMLSVLNNRGNFTIG